MNTEINHIISAEEIPKYALVCLNEKGLWIKADASTLVRMPALGLTLNAPRVGFSGNVLMLGIVNNNEWNWTPKGLLYVDVIPGGITQTLPAALGDKAQIVGYAVNETLIYFNPQYIIIEV